MKPILVAAFSAALLAAIAPPAMADLPVKYRAPAGSPSDPDAPPAGANDWGCRPSAERPRPVVLIPLTGGLMAVNWAALSPLLKNEGYCVFALNYGAYRSPLGQRYNGGQPVESSAAELAAFVDRVRAATGAEQVDLVGQSQGGILAEYYVKFLGGAPYVRHVVGLASPTKGGTLSGLLRAAANLRRTSPALGNALWGLVRGEAPSMLQLAVGSPFVAKLNSVREPEGVRYTKIASRWDPVATPYRNVFIDGADNVLLQRRCRLEFSDHGGMAFSRIALREVLNGLDPANARRIRCVLVLPGVGG
jgi:triacylglycerol esterase/lipase EstA (alpha/beta hydrolase family)